MRICLKTQNSFSSCWKRRKNSSRNCEKRESKPSCSKSSQFCPGSKKSVEGINPRRKWCRNCTGEAGCFFKFLYAIHIPHHSIRENLSWAKSNGLGSFFNRRFRRLTPDLPYLLVIKELTPIWAWPKLGSFSIFFFRIHKFRISSLEFRASGRSSRRRPLPEQERPANWLRFQPQISRISAGFAILYCFQRTYDILPILTLALFFQKGSICRERSTFVESPSFWTRQ